MQCDLLYTHNVIQELISGKFKCWFDDRSSACNYLHWISNDSCCFCLYLLGNIELAAASLDDVIRRSQLVSLTVDMIDLTMKYLYLTVCIDILTILSVSVFISQIFWFRRFLSFATDRKFDCCPDRFQLMILSVLTSWKPNKTLANFFLLSSMIYHCVY